MDKTRCLGLRKFVRSSATVVIATGSKRKSWEPETNSGQGYYIGDCQKAGDVLDAIHDAFKGRIEFKTPPMN